MCNSHLSHFGFHVLKYEHNAIRMFVACKCAFDVVWDFFLRLNIMHKRTRSATLPSHKIVRNKWNNVKRDEPHRNEQTKKKMRITKCSAAQRRRHRRSSLTEKELNWIDIMQSADRKLVVATERSIELTERRHIKTTKIIKMYCKLKHGQIYL